MAFSLPGITASFFDDLEFSLEKQIGRNGYESIIAEMEVVDLPEEERERLNKIFHRLVQACPPTRIGVQPDGGGGRDVNAFALPAGYIFVHTGLLAYVQSDGELAGVLDHEIAHVDRKHGMNAIKRQLGMGLFFRSL